MSLPPPPVTKQDLYGHVTPAGIYFSMRQHSIKSVHLEALAWSVDEALTNLSIDAGNLPPGGNEGDHLVINDLGNPEWMPQEDSGGGGATWHEIGRGEFLMSANFVSGPQVNRPTDVGQVAGHGAINATTGPMPVYHLAETADGEGGTKLFDLAGDEVVMEEEGATDYRATAIIEGTEYPVALNSSSLRVTDPDGTNVEHVPSWTFTASGISGTAPVQVELVVEASGGGGGGDSGCEFATYDEWRACGGSSGGGGSGGGNVDLQPLLDRIAALEALHDGTWEKHRSV